MPITRPLICRMCFLGCSILLMLGLQACTSTYTSQMVNKGLQTLHLKNNHTLVRHANWRLTMDTRFYLARPVYPIQLNAGTSSYPRSRTQLHSALESAFVESFPQTQVSRLDQNMMEARWQAQQSGNEILVYSRFLSYDDNLNSWNELNEGKGIHPNKTYGRDNTVFQVLLIETQSGRILDTASVSSQQRFFAPNELPTELFHQAANAYVQLLSGRVSHTE